jgi:hypothetical protein
MGEDMCGFRFLAPTEKQWLAISNKKKKRKAMARDGSSNLNHPKMTRIKAEGVVGPASYNLKLRGTHAFLDAKGVEMQKHLGWQLGK